jgi:hypothetical protein
MIGKWFPNGYVPSQIDVYTFINGDAEIPFFNNDNMIMSCGA